MLLYKFSIKNTDKPPNSCHSLAGLKFSCLIWLKMQLGRVRKEVKGVRRGKVSKGIVKLSILLVSEKVSGILLKKFILRGRKVEFLVWFLKSWPGLHLLNSQEHGSRPSTIFFSVLSSHSFCSVAMPGFCRDSCHCLLHYSGKCTHNSTSLKYYGYPNHCVKSLGITGGHHALGRIKTRDRFF